MLDSRDFIPRRRCAICRRAVPDEIGGSIYYDGTAVCCDDESTPAGEAIYERLYGETPNPTGEDDE